MAGIKNIYQHYGATPFETMKGETAMDRHMQLQAREYTPYCYLCGREIVEANQDESGRSVDYEWERVNQVHTRCSAARR